MRELQRYVVAVADRPRAMLSEEQRKALAGVLKDMISKPSSQAAAGRALGFSQQAIGKAVSYEDIGPSIRDSLLKFLHARGVIEEASVRAFMTVYGPDAVKKWTWEAVQGLPGLTGQQRIAIAESRKKGASPSAAGRVLTSPPWRSETFAHHPTPWWVSEILGVTARHMPDPTPQRLAEWTKEEADRRSA